jgi:hypothetical protein
MRSFNKFVASAFWKAMGLLASAIGWLLVTCVFGNFKDNEKIDQKTRPGRPI